MDKLLSAAKRISAVQARIEKLAVEGFAGGRMVSVHLNGKRECTRVTVDPTLLAASKKTMLEDLIKTAVTDASSKLAEAERAEQQAAMTEMLGEVAAEAGKGGAGGLGGALGGLFKGLK